MAANFQMPKVSRGVKLQPPAPLKKSFENSNNNNNQTPDLKSLKSVSCDINGDSTAVLSDKKENVFKNGRIGASRRTLKLEKPQPLKSSKVNQEPSESESSGSIGNNRMVLEQETAQDKSEPDRKVSRMTPNTAKATAEKLIKETLQELDDLTPICDHPSEEMRGRTHLLSQVSHDSGFSETSVYSRQGSMLESLEEASQDNSVWRYDDEEADPFSPDLTRDVFRRDSGVESCEQRMDRLCVKGENYVVPKFTRGRKSVYPENIQTIEMELESMRKELCDSDQSLDSLEEINEDESENKNRRSVELESNSVTKREPRPENTVLRDGGYVVLMREPICPTTMSDCIAIVERSLPGGPYSAKGRRRMFRSFKICRENEPVSQSSVIHYSAEDLLRIGLSRACRQCPDSWDYLSMVLPEVCMSKVDKYLDIVMYMDERSYVEEQTGYVKETLWQDSSRNSRLQTHMHSGSTGFQSNFENYRTEQPVRKGFGIPPPKPDSRMSDLMSFSSKNQTNDFFPFKKHSETSFNKTHSGFTPEIDQVDLDTKCDVRVPNKNQLNNGKIFNTARNDLIANVNKPYTTFDRSKEPVTVNMSEKMRSRNHSGGRERFYINRNLSENCPW